MAETGQSGNDAYQRWWDGGGHRLAFMPPSLWQIRIRLCRAMAAAFRAGWEAHAERQKREAGDRS